MATASQAMSDRVAPPSSPSDARSSAAALLLRVVIESCPAELELFQSAVAAASGVLAHRLGHAAAEAEAIARAGSLHDIGMALLLQPVAPDSRLGPNERHLARNHCQWGKEILSLAGPEYSLAAQVALQHHERWDGRGYPCGLREDEISMPARIVGVGAAYVSARMRGRQPFGRRDDAPFDRRGSSRRSDVAAAFDPQVLSACLDCRESLSDEVERALQARRERASSRDCVVSDAFL